jgi:glycosyltransferase involved in cell wall biosynthesis
MPNNVKISVLLPVYNADKYLHIAIDSVLNQSYKDFELLLLNDGSTDRSESIIDSYVSLDRRCKKLSWPNKGLIETLNTGIQEAKGEIIFRMDADDVCQVDRFETQVRYLDNHPECVAVGSRVLLIDAAGLPIMPFNVPIDHEDIDKGNFTGTGSAMVHPSVAMRRDVVKQIGGYRQKYLHAEDIDLFLRLAEVGSLYNIPEILLHYRQHADSIGYSKRQEQVKSVYEAISDAHFRRGTAQENYVSDEMFELSSISDIHKKWAWWAIRYGNKRTALKYALKVLKAKPLNLESIKLFLCAIRGH